MSPRGAEDIIPEPIFRLMERETATGLNERDTKSLDDWWDSLSEEDRLSLEDEAIQYQLEDDDDQVQPSS